MSLPSSGELRLSMIRTEIGAGQNSLKTNIASSTQPGFTKQSQFYGYSQIQKPTFSISVSAVTNNNDGTNPNGQYQVRWLIQAASAVPQATTVNITNVPEFSSVSFATGDTSKIVRVNYNLSSAFTRTAVIASSANYNIGTGSATITVPASNSFPVVNFTSFNNFGQQQAGGLGFAVTVPPVSVSLSPGGGLSNQTVSLGSTTPSVSFTYPIAEDNYGITAQILPGNGYTIGSPSTISGTILRQYSVCYVTNNTGRNPIVYINGNFQGGLAGNITQGILTQGYSDIVLTFTFSDSPTFDINIQRRSYNTQSGFSNVTTITYPGSGGPTINLAFSTYDYLITLTNSAVTPTYNATLTAGAINYLTNNTNLKDVQSYLVFSPSIPSGVTVRVTVSLTANETNTGTSAEAGLVNNGAIVAVRSTTGTSTGQADVTSSSSPYIEMLAYCTSASTSCSASYTITGATIIGGATGTITIGSPTTRTVTASQGSGSTGGGGGGGCLLPGQRVIVDEFFQSKNIEDLKIGDYVWTKHQAFEEYDYYKVINTYNREVSHWYMVKTATREIKCSPTHLFIIDGAQVKTEDLKIGDNLSVLKDKTLFDDVVVDIVKNDEKVNVFNIEVEDAHTYFTENKVLQHNKVQPVNPQL